MLFHSTQMSTFSSSRSRILVLENDTAVSRLIDHILDAYEYDVLHADNIDQASVLFTNQKPHLIILDYHLAQMNGLEWLSEICQQLNALLCPVILITGDCDKGIRERAYESGVLDCIRKPLEWVEFKTRVDNALSFRNAHHKLINEALTDPFTGLLTRQCLPQVKEELELLRDQDLSFTAFQLDIDHFQAINENFGSKVADQVLLVFAQRLRAFQLGQSWIIRMNGDKCIVLMLSTKETSQIKRISTELLERLNKVYQIDSNQIHLSCSIGIQHIQEFSPSDLDLLLKQSDQALTHAKAFHRGQAVMFDEHIRKKSDLRACVERDLEHAIEHRHFYLVFQPVVHADFQKIKSYEVLLRWKHPEMGEISPADFIPVVELLGKMPVLGKWVIRQSCKMIAEQAQFSEGQAPHLHINASRQELAQANYAMETLSILNEYQVAPSSITLEVTETHACNHMEQMKKNLLALRNEGISIALDDFGQGQSALTSIHQLPINCLKIDRAFISGISHDAKRMTILKYMIDMAHDLDFDVVAEGVEDLEQLCTLQSLGCRYLQGYLLGRPQRSLQKTIIAPRSSAKPVSHELFQESTEV